MEYEKQILIEDVEQNDSSQEEQSKKNIILYYLMMLKRKWFIVLAFIILGAIPAYFWAKRDPVLYVGNFEMLLEPITTEEQLTDPSVLSRIGTGTGNRNAFGVDYPTTIQVLKGRKILEEVATEISARYPQYPKSFLMSSFTRDLGVNRGKIGRSRFDTTKVITVAYRSSDPDLAITVLKTLADKYIEYSQEERETNLESGVNFIDRQIPVIRYRINQLQEKQKEIQRQYELIEPKTKGDTLFQSNTVSKQELLSIESQLKELNVIANKLQQDLGFSASDALVATTLSQDPERQALINQLIQIESEIARQSALVTSNHPTIVNLREQKQNIQNLLEQENRRVLQENNISSSVNPRVFVNQDSSRLGLINRLIETQSQIDALSSRYQSLLRNQSRTAGELAIIPSVIKEYSDLQRQIELDTNILNQLTSQKEALSVDVAQKQSPWKILAEPQIPLNALGQPQGTATDPKKKIAMGVGAGLFLGLLVAFLIEKRRDVFYEPNDLNYMFGLPILGLLPKTEQKKSSVDENNFFAESQNIENVDSDKSPFLDASISEVYANLHFQLPNSDEKQYVLISSIEPEDGQGYVCANLAQIAANINEKVLIVDGEPSEDISLYLDRDRIRRGLAELSPTPVVSSDSTTTIESLSPPPTTSVSLLSAGTENSDIPWNIGADETQNKIKSIARDYSLILYNTSWFLDSHYLSLLAQKTQGIVMVVKLKETPQSAVKEAIERIQNYNLNFLGFVLAQ